MRVLIHYDDLVKANACSVALNELLGLFPELDKAGVLVTQKTLAKLQFHWLSWLWGTLDLGRWPVDDFTGVCSCTPSRLDCAIGIGVGWHNKEVRQATIDGIMLALTGGLG